MSDGGRISRNWANCRHYKNFSRGRKLSPKRRPRHVNLHDAGQHTVPEFSASKACQVGARPTNGGERATNQTLHRETEQKSRRWLVTGHGVSIARYRDREQAADAPFWTVMMVNYRARVPWTMRDDSCTSGFNAGNDEQGHQFANLSNLPPPSSGRQVQSCPPAAIHVSELFFFCRAWRRRWQPALKSLSWSVRMCGSQRIQPESLVTLAVQGGSESEVEEGKGASETQSNRASDSARIVSSSCVGKDDMWSSAGLSLESWASPPQPPTQAPVVAARFRQVVVFASSSLTRHERRGRFSGHGPCHWSGWDPWRERVRGGGREAESQGERRRRLAREPEAGCRCRDGFWGGGRWEYHQLGMCIFLFCGRRGLC